MVCLEVSKHYSAGQTEEKNEVGCSMNESFLQVSAFLNINGRPIYSYFRVFLDLLVIIWSVSTKLLLVNRIHGM